MPEGFRNAHQIAQLLGDQGPWGQKYQSQVADLEGMSFLSFVCRISDHALDAEIVHAIIDLLISAAQNPLANTSPSTPSSPSPHLSRTQHAANANANVQVILPPYSPDQLMRMKIAMREAEHPPRYRQGAVADDPTADSEASLLGRNEGTVRFLFGPLGSANASV